MTPVVFNLALALRHEINVLKGYIIKNVNDCTMWRELQ